MLMLLSVCDRHYSNIALVNTALGWTLCLTAKNALLEYVQQTVKTDS